MSLRNPDWAESLAETIMFDDRPNITVIAEQFRRIRNKAIDECIDEINKSQVEAFLLVAKRIRARERKRNLA